ncbi:MAG: SH3 domain-containing protein [Lachnospiraceae bacterium]|nr:SH3 domain-containing protein [Lachnospiraceae bacterium]
MKRKVVSGLIVSVLTTSLFTACGTATTNLTESTEETVSVAEAQSPEPTEAPHEHTYTEAVTAEAACETDGVKTFSCECGDSYTEAIPATGHSFTNYVYNEDAAYTADGTETAKCDNCGETDTRTAEGTILTYTFHDMSAAKYAKSTVTVRNLPDTDGEKVGSLSMNQEVAVTGQCNETGWYRIELDGNTAYVSDSYLVDNQIETQTESSTGTTASDTSATVSSSNSGECPYALYTVIDEGGDNVYFYCLWDGVNSVGSMPGYWETFNACIAILNERHGGNDTGCGAGSEETDYYVDGLRVVKQLPTSR